MIAIIDYFAGNLTSVKRSLDYLNIKNEITDDKQKIKDSIGIIFPGVGAAGSAMKNLISKGRGIGITPFRHMPCVSNYTCL